jgi:gamma-glutamyltranspeptidase/glutathione hydrolase
MIRPIRLIAVCLAGLAWLAAPMAAPASGAAARASAATPARGMVVASQADAARAGAEMLEAGGNAVDAAVATAFALAVTQPFSAGLGGGAFVLIRRADGAVVALDARETAPAAADRDMYVRPGVADDASLRGALAVATPGFVPGLARALTEHGTLPLPRVLAPAIRLADEGFAIGPYHAAMLEIMRDRGLPEAFPETGRIQFPPAGEPARPGWRLRQPDLARTLQRLAELASSTPATSPPTSRVCARRCGGATAASRWCPFHRPPRGAPSWWRS